MSEMKTTMYQYYEPVTTGDVLRVLNISLDDLTALRVEIGMTYLRHKVGEFAPRLWVEPGFWTWYLHIWESNDKYYLSQLELGVKMGLKEYRQVHLVRSMKYAMNKSVEVRMAPKYHFS